MNFYAQILVKQRLKILLFLFFISLLSNSYDMLFNLIKSEASFNHGRPKKVLNVEGLLALVGYFSLVGIAFCLFSAYLNNDFRKDSFPDMSFDHFKDEPQFNSRDWANFNESCKKEIDRLKGILNKTQGEEKVLENEPLMQLNNGVIRKNRSGTILPTLQNSATLEANEITHLRNKISQSLGRRAKLSNAIIL